VARVVEVAGYGGPEVLRVVERPDPEPGEGQVLVEVAAAGVNYVDVYQRSGSRRAAPTPFAPGLEGAGMVRALGPGVADVAVGDHVGWADQLGSYATLAVVRAERTVPVPAAVGDEVAAAVLLQGTTAHYLATSVHPVAAGEWVVVHAAAGGVGLLLTQIVKLRGGRVLGTTSTEEKAALAHAAGADEVVVGYEGFAAAARRLTAGEGVAAAYDGVGRTTFDDSLSSLRRRGVLALYGAASGAVPPFDPQRLSEGSRWLTRPMRLDYTATRQELLDRSTEVLDWVADGRLHLHIGGRHPLDQARRAHEDLEARRTTGKLLLLP
jgi:NADPH2:quinone reductase